MGLYEYTRTKLEYQKVQYTWKSLVLTSGSITVCTYTCVCVYIYIYIYVLG